MSVFFGAFNKAIASEIESKVPLAWKPRKYDPNPQQQAFIDALMSSDSNLNLIACAGTGKTSTLLMALPYIADSHCDVTVSTMHAAGFRAWNAHNRAKRIQVDANKVRSIIDELGIDQDVYVRYGIVIRKWVSLAKQSGFGIEGDFPSVTDARAWLDIWEYFSLGDDMPGNGSMTPELLLPYAQSVYTISLRKCTTVVDFDDMLLAPLYHRATFRHYDYVLLDEAQDTNAVRRELAIRMLRPGSGRLIAVGDPNQAIYGFTGADSDAMDLIRERLESQELPLTVTYRCPKLIVHEAQQWVPAIQAHESAPEGAMCAVNLKPDPNTQDKSSFWDLGPFTADDAVLCRLNRPIVALAYEMLRKRIPCRIEGRDIGQSLIALCKKWKVTELDDLVDRLEDYKEREMAKYLKARSESKAAAVEDKVDTLMCLIDAARAEGNSRVVDVIDLINRMFGDTPEGEKPKCLTLSSVHKAKGREWRRVFILGRDRYMPSKWAKKDWEQRQERNLLYVAVTRSMETLIDVIVPPDMK